MELLRTLDFLATKLSPGFTIQRHKQVDIIQIHAKKLQNLRQPYRKLCSPETKQKPKDE